MGSAWEEGGEGGSGGRGEGGRGEEEGLRRLRNGGDGRREPEAGNGKVGRRRHDM